MNSKQKETFRKILEKPPRADVNWKDIEKLFISLGAVVKEREGSRMAVMLNDKIAIFHRPHPRKETDKGALVSVRKFLENAGVDRL